MLARPRHWWLEFFHLLHLSPNINNPIWWASWSERLGGLILNGCSNYDSWRNLKNEGRICSSDRYMVHLYCLVLQADFYSSLVECWPVMQTAHLRSLAAALVISYTFVNQKRLIVLLISLQNEFCWYLLEAPCLGASNEYPQHMYTWRNKKNNYLIPLFIKSYGYRLIWPVLTIIVSNINLSDKMPDTNSAGPDQTALLGAVWSGPTLFACLPSILWRRHTKKKNILQAKNVNKAFKMYSIFIYADLSWLCILNGNQEIVDLIPTGYCTSIAIFFCGDLLWNIFYCHSLPSADSRRAVNSFWSKNMHKYWLNTWRLKSVQENCVGKLTGSTWP